jgi:GT2 family glycosyltransferase
VKRWRSSEKAIGHGYVSSLATFEAKWIHLSRMRQVGGLYECPALVGCCLAVSKRLYEKLRGFDRNMIEWGVEDVDLGLKAWLMGHGILHNHHAVIAHRFRTGFTNFTVRGESVMANQIRSVRKNYDEKLWREWKRRAEKRTPRRIWEAAWELFESRKESAEEEREYLLSRRVHSEEWYARRFGLRWP